MNAVVESVRSLWVPLEGMNLLVPNVAVAELINYQPLDAGEDGPDWLLGRLRWRNCELPVIAMERLFGLKRPQGQPASRIAVINSVNASAALPFYAVMTAGIPRLFNADADGLGGSVRDGQQHLDLVADCVRIGSEEALIPDLEQIQALIEKDLA